MRKVIRSGSVVFQKLRNFGILKAQEEERKRAFTKLVLSALLYDCKTRKLTKEEDMIIDALLSRRPRKIMRIRYDGKCMKRMHWFLICQKQIE